MESPLGSFLCPPGFAGLTGLRAIAREGSAMSEAVQALCFFAGANSIFYGDKLLTTDNPDVARDDALFAELGIAPG